MHQVLYNTMYHSGGTQIFNHKADIIKIKQRSRQKNVRSQSKLNSSSKFTIDSWSSLTFQLATM